MKTYITVSDSVGSDRVETTLDGLNSLSEMPEWEGVTFSQTFRYQDDDAVDVIICDQSGEVVAVQPGYENGCW